MKSRYVGGLLVVVAGLSFEACSSPGVGFTLPGVGGDGGGGVAPNAGRGGAGASNGGAPARAGTGGDGERAGAVGDAGDFGDGGEPNLAGSGGAPHGGAGSGGSGGAPHAGAGAGGAGAGAAGAGAGGAGAGGAGAGGAGAGGAGAGGAGAGGAGAGGAGAGAGAGGAGAGGAGAGGAGTGGGLNPTPVCGNNLLESGEQCDDGNTAQLDACAANCAFEESQRANWFKVQFTTDTFCTANRFGSAFPVLSRAALQQNIDARVADGSFSMLFAFLGLADPKGPNGSSFSLGVLNGTPAAGTSYDGKSDLDWWYAPAAGTVDANKSPVSKLVAQISAGALSATGAKLLLPLISGQPLSVSSVQLRFSIGASSKPLTSTGAPPGHLAAEHLSTTLTSFASGGVQTDAGAGELCGNISAASLAAEQIPPDYLVTGGTPCSQGYTAGNTFLDLVVSGCTFVSGPFSTTALIATQPDTADPNVTDPGAGAPYKLSANATRAVSACTDKNGLAVNLANCLTAAAYSSAFKLATDRVIIK